MPKIHRLPDRHADTEKITLNIGLVDLGRIDLLVREGFYTNRTDFIRTAIRSQLTTDARAVEQSVERHQFEMGLFDVTRPDLEALRDSGEVLHLRVLGLARIAEDVPVELARDTIGSISVLGSLQATKELKAALADHIT
ncbi:CopG family transcripitonal regulator [Roseivivax halodurans JCM 10272]|uniref:CopG family transcripitonal regulator n=1 Tax=Roseivivax halodurans JCM 10272 TaxID=1449350 RepID=X7EJQ4_9RHOB|nr:CopG family transcriptional regulator [Roseivivax halodurans]ETX16334.1 CopG family transcripitonal regulator [Roseivivax halodurans JCM 10272]